MNLKSGRSRTRHVSMDFETRSNAFVVPAIIAFVWVVVVHISPHGVACSGFTLENTNTPPILIEVVVKWNGEHEAERFIHFRNVIRHCTNTTASKA